MMGTTSGEKLGSMVYAWRDNWEERKPKAECAVIKEPPLR